MNKQEIIAILRAAPSREIKFPTKELKPATMSTIEWLGEHGVECLVQKDGTIQVHGNIDIPGQGLTRFPVDFSMCVIDGDFYCSRNKLKSLEGCPKFVTGYFFAHNNPYINLKHISRGCIKYFTDFGYFSDYSEIPKELL